MTFAHVTILLFSLQRVAEYLMALKHIDYFCSLGYKQPITSKNNDVTFTRGLKLQDLILSFLVLSSACLDTFVFFATGCGVSCGTKTL